MKGERVLVIREHMNDIFTPFLKQALDATNVGVVITDPEKDDNPIVYINKGFTNLTGYTEEDVLGKNCRFLQGADTERAVVQSISQGIKEKKSIHVELINYRKDGTPFRNELIIDPIYIDNTDRTFFIGVQKDVTEQYETKLELEDTLKEVQRLSTPIVPITNSISVIPLIGSLTFERVEVLYKEISASEIIRHNQIVIIDLSGLAFFDDQFGINIGNIHKMLNLLGIELVLTGFSPNMAVSTQTYIEQLRKIKVYKDIKSALGNLAV